MSGFSTYEAQRLIAALQSGRTLYVALFTSDPTDDNVTANEVSGAWYARQLIGSMSAPTGSGVMTSNSNQVTFSAVTGSTVVVSYYALYDAITGGHLTHSFPVTNAAGTPTPRTFSVDDVPIFAAGEIQISYL